MTGQQGCGSPTTILAACFEALAASNNSNIRGHCLRGRRAGELRIAPSRAGETGGAGGARARGRRSDGSRGWVDGGGCLHPSYTPRRR